MVKIASAKLIKMTVLPKVSAHAAVHASLESPYCRTNASEPGPQETPGGDCSVGTPSEGQSPLCPTSAQD